MTEDAPYCDIFLTPKSRVLGEHVPKQEYVPAVASTGDSIIRKGLHFGQRKLLLSEVEFLSTLVGHLTGLVEGGEVQMRGNKAQGKMGNDSSNTSPSLEGKPILVVYAGAANGQHLPFLFTLFPNIKFILIDPAPFCRPVVEIAKQENGPIVAVIKDNCTVELCEELRQKYSKEYHIFLVSDIRSGVPKKMTSNASHTAMILKDNAQQEEWCTALQPEWAMLKFHPPYPPQKDANSQGYDPDDTTPEFIDYLGGVCLFGVWAPKSSSEVRLVTQGPFPQPRSRRRLYSCLKHEQQCYYYNCAERYQRDCAAERVIWEKYLSLLENRSDEFSALMDSSLLWGSLRKAVAMYSNNVEKLSKAASHALRHGDFMPLSSQFTEHHARWFALVSSITRVSWNPVLRRFFEKWKPYMSIETVERLVHEYQFANTIPARVKVYPGAHMVTGAALPEIADEKTDFPNERNGEVLPLVFWNYFSRGNFAEAYSISRLQWAFFPQLPPLIGRKSESNSGTMNTSHSISGRSLEECQEMKKNKI